MPRGGEKIGAIGMGASVIGAKPEAEIIATVRGAVDARRELISIWRAVTRPFSPPTARRLRAVREKVYLQVHFGADYTSGEYGWTTKLD